MAAYYPPPPGSQYPSSYYPPPAPQQPPLEWFNPPLQPQYHLPPEYTTTTSTSLPTHLNPPHINIIIIIPNILTTSFLLSLSLKYFQFLLEHSSAPYIPQDVNACPTLFVADLGPTCTEEELIQVFSRFPGYLKLKMQSTYGAPVAFVDFQDAACSSEARNRLQGTILYSSPPGKDCD
ncbi:hypothetical protein LguiB_019408 [Lonicera macranthoides]